MCSIQVNAYYMRGFENVEFRQESVENKFYLWLHVVIEKITQLKKTVIFSNLAQNVVLIFTKGKKISDTKHQLNFGSKRLEKL